MTARTEAVRRRTAAATGSLSAAQLLIALGLLAGLTYLLVLVQDPTAHEALHSFRHGSGVVCH